MHEAVLEFTGERVVPWTKGMRDWVWVLQHHLQRYTWALGAVAGKDVVDLGCGSGYGSFLMSFVAESVWGLDISTEAISFASRYFERKNTVFSTHDLEHDPLPAGRVYTCFEVIEHLENPQTFVANIPGTLLWSIPVSDGGQFHKHVYNVNGIRNLMGDCLFYAQDDQGRISSDPALFATAKYVVGVRL